MKSLKRYHSRITSSDRGKVFNPLMVPFLFSTLAYAIGFVFLGFTDAVGSTALYIAMYGISPVFPLVWGVIGFFTILGGVTFLLFNIPPFGKVTGLIGFMLWSFGSVVFVLTGGWLPLFSVGMPNMYFWFWQYLSLCKFRREEAADIVSMERYEDGDYK